jgi:hypothetical protein
VSDTLYVLLLPGYLTQERIYQYALNMYAHDFGAGDFGQFGSYPSWLTDFLDENEAWTDSMVAHRAHRSEYWARVRVRIRTDHLLIHEMASRP